MRVCLLASGSKGNAVYIENAGTHLLIDAGLSGKALTLRLAELGVDPSQLDALLVSHEHSDHCQGIGPLARRYDLPVVVHPETLNALPKLGRIDQLITFDVGQVLSIGAVTIATFPTAHDAACPVGYTVTGAEGKVGLATDLGLATRLVVDQLQHCRVLIVETNHDQQMLRDGPYPWPVKQRIKSRLGHLCNEGAGELVRAVDWQGLEAIFLAHLSETNNCPDLAAGTIRQALMGRHGPEPELIIGQQDRISTCFTT